MSWCVNGRTQLLNCQCTQQNFITKGVFKSPYSGTVCAMKVKFGPKPPYGTSLRAVRIIFWSHFIQNHPNLIRLSYWPQIYTRLILGPYYKWCNQNLGHFRFTQEMDCFLVWSCPKLFKIEWVIPLSPNWIKFSTRTLFWH